MKHCFTVYIVVPYYLEHSTVCGCARFVEQVVMQILKSGKNPPPIYIGTVKDAMQIPSTVRIRLLLPGREKRYFRGYLYNFATFLCQCTICRLKLFE